MEHSSRRKRNREPDACTATAEPPHQAPLLQCGAISFPCPLKMYGAAECNMYFGAKRHCILTGKRIKERDRWMCRTVYVYLVTATLTKLVIEIEDVQNHQPWLKSMGGIPITIDHQTIVNCSDCRSVPR
eukprot:scpid81383/ scgid10202/ 